MTRRITEKMKQTFPNIPWNYPVHGSKLSRTSTSCTKIQPQLRPQQTSLKEINNGKFQKSTPQMKKSEEHQQIGLNH